MIEGIMFNTKKQTLGRCRLVLTPKKLHSRFQFLHRVNDRKYIKVTHNE